MNGWEIKQMAIQYLSSLPDDWWMEKFKDWQMELTMQTLRERLFKHDEK